MALFSKKSSDGSNPDADKNPPADANPPAPTYVTNEQFQEGLKQLGESFREGISALRDGWVQQAGRSSRPEPEPELPDPSEDDDVPTAVNKAVNKQLAPLRRELAQFENLGLATIEKLTHRQVSGGLPYYNRFKKEIDATLAQMTPAQRAQPEAIEVAHNMVVGHHIAEITAETRDEEQRKVRASTPPPPKHGAHSTQEDYEKKGLPSPADLGLTPAQIRAVEKRGGFDKWARRMSGGQFKNYEDYAKSAMSMREPEGESEEEEE